MQVSRVEVGSGQVPPARGRCPLGTAPRIGGHFEGRACSIHATWRFVSPSCFSSFSSSSPSLVFATLAVLAFCRSCAGGSPPSVVSVACYTRAVLEGPCQWPHLWAPHQHPRRSSCRGARLALLRRLLTLLYSAVLCRLASRGFHQGPCRGGRAFVDCLKITCVREGLCASTV